MNINYSSDGVLMSPEFHDGYLKGIMLEANDQLSLHCEDIDGNRGHLLIPNLVSLRSDNFRQGNIIFEFRVYSGEQIPRRLIAKVEYFVEPVEDSINKRVSEIAQNGWSLLELGSSYGCELLALFDGKPEDVKFIAA